MNLSAPSVPAPFQLAERATPGAGATEGLTRHKSTSARRWIPPEESASIRMDNVSEMQVGRLDDVSWTLV